jgi:hypothetical protein
MHMLLILLALCLRKPNGISHLFSIAYAFAGNGWFVELFPYLLDFTQLSVVLRLFDLDLHIVGHEPGADQQMAEGQGVVSGRLR